LLFLPNTFRLFSNGWRGAARTYFPHIYFEAARPRTRDSVTKAVGELDRKPGVTSFKEYKLVAFAQLADYIDKLTVNHKGKVVRFTKKLFNGRMLVLIRLGKKKWPRKYKYVVNLIKKAAKEMDNARSKAERVKVALEIAKKLRIPPKTAKSIIKKVNQRK